MDMDLYNFDWEYQRYWSLREYPPRPEQKKIINEIIEAENLTKSEVIYFGDKDADVKVAQNAGIDLILVTYGQGSPEDYANPYPLKVIDKAKEILELINEGIIHI